jgi:LysM repeat protein
MGYKGKNNLYICLKVKIIMRYKLFFITLLVLVTVINSCSTSKPIVSTSHSGQTEEAYINTYKDLAISEMKRTGIPASITLAQGMIESDYGRSQLARDGNNHFGIKCHSDWTGPTLRHHDDKRNECFRKYRKAEESFYDHSDFLKSGSRYSFLFDIDHTDYKAWARGLKKAGYATNPDYANMLIRTIEENNLWYFDQGKMPQNKDVKTVVAINEEKILNKKTEERPIEQVNDNYAVPARVSRIMENNRVHYIIVKDGDTKEKLEKEFNLLRWELAKYNELDSDFQPIAGQILYLQPKREKAEPGKETHIPTEGETIYQISQKYGIKLKSIYELNRMNEGEEPEAGKKIWLRNIKPVN